MLLHTSESEGWQQISLAPPNLVSIAKWGKATRISWGKVPMGGRYAPYMS